MTNTLPWSYVSIPTTVQIAQRVTENISATFQRIKFITHYVAPQFFIFRRTVQTAPKFPSLKCTHISLQDIPNSITPQTTLRLLPIAVGLLVLPCTHHCKWSPLTLFPPFFPLSQTEEPAKASTCARDRRVLQQLALNVHVKHSDLT